MLLRAAYFWNCYSQNYSPLADRIVMHNFLAVASRKTTKEPVKHHGGGGDSVIHHSVGGNFDGCNNTSDVLVMCPAS